MNYKIRKDLSINLSGKKIFRIECIKSFKHAEKGEIGGYIESKDNLSDNAWVSGDAMVSDNAIVYGDARVYGNAMVSGDAKVFDNTIVSGNARVYGNAKVSDNAIVYGNARVYDDAIVFGNAWVYDDAIVFGNAWVSVDAKVYGNARVFGDKITKQSDIYNITSNAQYNITITPNFIKIGCEFHKKTEWWKFTNKEILEMDGKEALKFWKKWKPILKGICND